MKLNPITDIPEFKAVAEPLQNLSREIKQNEEGLETIQAELSRLASKEANTASAWNSYLNADADALSRRDELRRDAAKIEGRQALLKEALSQGRMEVDNTRNRLSRQPWADARPLTITHVRKILAALDEIDRANRALMEIRNAIEEAGYRSGSLPPAGFNLDRAEAYKIYIKQMYPELK
jgi:chromosome segregation ATPase